jgi:hypothetical protein
LIPILRDDELGHHFNDIWYFINNLTMPILLVVLEISFKILVFFFENQESMALSLIVLVIPNEEILSFSYEKGSEPFQPIVSELALETVPICIQNET